MSSWDDSNQRCVGWVYDMWEVIARENRLSYSVIPITSTNRNLRDINGKSNVDISITFLAFIVLNLVIKNNSYTQSIDAADYTFVLFDKTKFQSAEISLVTLIFTRPVVALLLAVCIVMMLAAAVGIILDRKLRHKIFQRPEMIYSQIFGLLIEYVWRIMVYEITMKGPKKVRMLQLIISLIMFIVFPIFQALLSSSLTNYEAAGQPMTIDAAALQRTVLLCDLDTSEVMGGFLVNRGIVLIIVDDIVLEVARYVINGTKPPGVSSAIDGFLSTTVEVRGLLQVTSQLDKSSIIISAPFTPNGVPVPKGFAVASLAASWLLPIVDLGLTRLRDSGQMTQLLNVYLPPVFTPTKSTSLDVGDTTFYALIVSGSVILFSWIIAILYAKLKRWRWKQGTSLMFSNDLYSYVDVTEGKNKPSSFVSALETSVYLEQLNQETFRVSVPQTQTHKKIELSAMKPLHCQGHIADPRELFSDRYANIKSAGDTSDHAIVSFVSPQRGNSTNKSFTQTQRQHLADADAKDSADHMTSDMPSFVFHDHQQAPYKLPRSFPAPPRRRRDHENAASVPISPQYSRTSHDGAVGGSGFALDALARELSDKTTISNSNEVLIELSARLQACGVSSLSDLKGMSREDVRASVADAHLTPLQFTKLFHACV